MAIPVHEPGSLDVGSDRPGFPHNESAALALPYCWDKNTLSTAPPSLRELCAATGGLRSGQRLLAGRTGELVLFGLRSARSSTRTPSRGTNRHRNVATFRAPSFIAL
jgi:hypothetical protein